MQVECVLSKGVNTGQAAGLCDALRAAAPLTLRLHVLATTPSSISAMIERTEGAETQTGPQMDFNIIDQNLTVHDYDQFARDLLRFGLPD